jgi:iron complex outermembrane receptor protein
MTATRTRRFTAALMTCTALGLSMTFALAAPGPAHAADVAEDAQVIFDIAAQPLGAAIDAFIDATGWQVGYTAEIMRDRASPGVAGRLTPTAALTRLLSGTGVTFRLTGARTVALDGPQASGDRITMGTIAVEGRGIPRQSEIGTLPPVYAGGQVARGGKLGLLGNRDMMDTPFNQMSYTADLARNQQSRTIGELAENDPSLTMSFPSSAGIDNFKIRGFDVLNSDVAFGGLYGITPTSSNRMAAESIERVEVLKGPNTLLNGISPTGRVGGAINVIPKRADDTPLAQVSPEYASDAQFGGHIDVGRRFGDNNEIGVRFNGVLRDGDTAIKNQSQETQVASLALDYQAGPARLSADLGYQYQRLEGTRRPLALSTGVAVPSAPDSSSNYDNSWTFADNTNWYGAVRGEYDLFDNLSAFIAVGGSIGTFKSQSHNGTISASDGTYTPNPFALSGFDQAATAETGMRGSATTGMFHHDLALTGAAFWKKSGSYRTTATIASSNIFSPTYVSDPGFADLGDPDEAPKTSQQQNLGLAFADTISAYEERVQLTAGVRWQRIASKSFNRNTDAQSASYDDSALTPAVGLVVKPWEKVSVYGNYIQALTAGPTAPGSASNSGEIFPPTVTDQYEGGVKLDFGRLATTFSVFQITQPNGFTDPATNIFAVDGEQRNRGVEALVFGEAMEGVRLLSGITYFNAELTKTSSGTSDGNRAHDVPKIQINISGEWDTPFMPGLTLSARAMYVSSKFVDDANTQKVPDWARFDLGVRYTFERQGGQPIVVRATVRNVLNSDYWATADGRVGLSDPRTFLLSASFDL